MEQTEETRQLLAQVRALEAAGDEAAADALLRRALAQPQLHETAATLLRERLVADGAIDAAIARFPNEPGDRRPFALIGHALAAHRRGDFAAAAGHAAAFLELRADDPVALNHRARALHNLGERARALATFRRATDVDPASAIAWHNLGQALRAGGAINEALEAFARAAVHRPGFRSACVNLGKTQLLAADARAALATFEAWLARAPADHEARLDRALALHQLGRNAEAIDGYRDVTVALPDHAFAWYCLGAALNESGDSAAARQALERALALAPGDAEAWAELAALHEFDNRLEDAALAVQRGSAAAPGHPRLLVEAARIARRQGHPAAAEGMLARLDPLQLPPRARAGYWFERGRSLDRLGEPARAFEAFRLGNRLARQSGADRAVDEAAQPALVAATAEWLRTPGSARWMQAAMPPAADAPVFLLGFARSGITLLNVILAGVPGVRTLEEKPTIERCSALLADMPGGYPKALDALDERGVAQVRADYWKALREFGHDRGQGTLVDMYPMRTALLPLVARLFPDARTVFVRRHPCDVVLSNFMQHYALNPATAHFFDLAGTVELYASTMELWLAMRARLPLRLVDLCYEDLARQPEPTLRALLDALGLRWTDAVLRHAERLPGLGRISTSSYHQVAEPVHARAAGRWTLYRAQLEPHLPRLAPIATALGYEI